MNYNLELDKIVSEIKSSKARRVGLQFPEGLKEVAVDVAREIESMTGAEAFIMSDPTYGACDMKGEQAKELGLDLVVHFGHTEYGRF